MNVVETAISLYNQYKKTVMAAITAVAVTIAALSGGLTQEETVAVVAAWAGVLAVYQARNVKAAEPVVEAAEVQ